MDESSHNYVMDHAEKDESSSLLATPTAFAADSSSNSLTRKITIGALGVLTFAAIAAVGISKPTMHGDAVSTKVQHLSVDPASEFSSGAKKSTDLVKDGTINVLSGNALKLDCAKVALTGFNLVLDKSNVELGDQIKYDYFCDDSGAPFENNIRRVSHNTAPKDGAVKTLGNMYVDCSTTGLNYVITYLDLALDESKEKFHYEYGCSTYEGAMLTCTDFFTDTTSPAVYDDSVGSLSEHSVSCFEGSALQSFRYQTVGEEVRYAYSCCTKAHIPTPAPTALPTEEPSAIPTLAPVAELTLAPAARPTRAPVAERTEEPVAEPSEKPISTPTLEPSDMPTLSPKSAPTSAPVAEDTVRPTRAPVADRTGRPSHEPISRPTLRPIAKPTATPTTVVTSIETKVADELLVEAAQLPRFCPFTFLKGTSDLEVTPGCALITQDQLVYMRDDETSPSLYVCTAAELPAMQITLEDMFKYGLITPDGEGTVSDIRIGAGTKLQVNDNNSTILFTVTPDDQRLIGEREVDEQQIHLGLLTTTISATDVKIPATCGSTAGNAKAAAEGNLEIDK